ncbi:MAG: type II secretion system protein GspD, partial [Vampirovibrionales bacterium]
RLNGTLTIMGTPELMELADKVIRENDVERPQVMIEVALVEMSASNKKVWDISGASLRFGEFSVAGLVGGKSVGISSGNGSPTGNKLSPFNLTFTDDISKGKILANPTIIALDGMNSTVSIQDQLVYFTQQLTPATATSPAIITETVNTQPVGIQLSITPQVTNDGMVHMQLNPTITQLIRIERSPLGAAQAPVTTTRTLNFQRVRVRDGETLVLGGLLREAISNTGKKIPGLSDLPIVGAMFRTSNQDVNERSEVIMLVTPHILRDKDNSPFYFNETTGKPLNADKYPHAQATYNGMVNQRTLPKLLDTSSLPASAKPIATGGNATVTRSTFDMRELQRPTSSAPKASKVSNKASRSMAKKSAKPIATDGNATVTRSTFDMRELQRPTSSAPKASKVSNKASRSMAKKPDTYFN